MAFATLAGIVLTWTQIVPGGGQTFVQYNVYRDGVRIAVITAIATVTFTDYNTGSGTSHTYAVTWTANVSGSLLESAQATVAGSVTFTGTFLHAVDLPSAYAEIPCTNVQLSRAQDIAYQRARGRSVPTAFINQLEAHVITMTLDHFALRDRTYWNELLVLQTRQRVNGSTLCLRWGYGSGEVYFVGLDGIARVDDPQWYTPTLPFHEVFYSEVV